MERLDLSSSGDYLIPPRVFCIFSVDPPSYP